MILLAVVLGVVAVVGIVVALLTMSRLGEQRRLTTAAEARSSERARELETTSAELAEAARQRASADERAAVEAARADGAEADREQARQDAEQATAARIAAEERASNAERRAADFAAARAAADDGGIDAQLLWTLEQARSERTWRHSVAPGPDSVSVFSDASDPLFEALQVELDAAREEVGAVVELDVDLPPGVTAAGSMLALRAAQELLAGVVRRGEVTTLHVHADGPDLVVAVRSVDEDGVPVPTEPLAIPASAAVELAPDGVRVLGAVQPIDGAADQTVAGEDGDDSSVD